MAWHVPKCRCRRPKGKRATKQDEMFPYKLLNKPSWARRNNRSHVEFCFAKIFIFAAYKKLHRAEEPERELALKMGFF